MQDSKQWPYDPPLSDAGLAASEQLGVKLHRAVCELGAELNVVITSPYLRCVQTAACICKAFGKRTKLLIDNSLGEIYGPCIMQDEEPASPVRPLQQSADFCHSQGVTTLEVRKILGKWPVWPETLKGARQRFAARFVDYVKRGYAVHRNFMIVSHADCVGGALALIPCGTCRNNVEKVNFGGHFMVLCPQLTPPSDSESSEDDPVEQLERTAAAAVRRMAVMHPDKQLSPEVGLPPPPIRVICLRSRAAAVVRREEALQAVRAKKEWSILQGYEEEYTDVSDLGNDIDMGREAGSIRALYCHLMS
ncbi:unnamed protein product [Symbiodinium natans]|uniref:Uncharacterized protein n=1 Tax=Symbiodinium natans TaxID=878477 RepID=A0A812K376_9DINO|nr:unnamed protein product [Symbiodinium natans]